MAKNISLTYFRVNLYNYLLNEDNVSIMFPYLMEPSWKKALGEELEKSYLSTLFAFVENERFTGNAIYPPNDLVFNAFLKTPFDKVKVVIVGQDPYHRKGQAHGLSFSVPPGVNPPPSLKNIYKELEQDVAFQIPNHGTLIKWAEQGVFLLNAALTVAEGKPMSHHGKGWERFTDAVIEKLAQREDPIVFLLWGRSAQDKCKSALKGVNHHLVLTAAHPSPLSAYNGFFGCRHFSKANEQLKQWGKTAIEW